PALAAPVQASGAFCSAIASHPSGYKLARVWKDAKTAGGIASFVSRSDDTVRAFPAHQRSQFKGECTVACLAPVGQRSCWERLHEGEPPISIPARQCNTTSGVKRRLNTASSFTLSPPST